MSLVGRTVDVEKNDSKGKKDSPIFMGRVFILDKVMTNMADYLGAAVMNNASFDVYLGVFDNEVIFFKPTEVVKIY